MGATHVACFLASSPGPLEPGTRLYAALYVLESKKMLILYFTRAKRKGILINPHDNQTRHELPRSAHA